MTMNENTSASGSDFFDEVDRFVEMRWDVFACVVVNSNVFVFVAVCKSWWGCFWHVQDSGDTEFIEKFFLWRMVSAAQINVWKNRDRAQICVRAESIFVCWVAGEVLWSNKINLERIWTGISEVAGLGEFWLKVIEAVYKKREEKKCLIS